MKPKKQGRSASDDLFRMRLEQILDQRHVLYRLFGKIDWSVLEERFGGLYAEEGRSGIAIRLMVDCTTSNTPLMNRMKPWRHGG